MRTAVAMCTYNGEAYLAEQLDSILRQSYLPDMLYIYDDGSGDSTCKILQQYQKNNPKRFILLRDGRHRGINRGMQFLLSHIEADAVFLCDQDDIWLPHKVKTLLLLAEAQQDWHTTPYVIHSEARLKPDTARLHVMSDLIGTRRHTPELEELFCHNLVQGCTMLINQPMLLMMTGFIDNEFPHCLYDQWMALIAKAFGNILFYPWPLVEYRIHESNTVGTLTLNIHEKHGLSRNRKLACEFLYRFGDQLSQKSRQRIRHWIQTGHEQLRPDNLLHNLIKGGLALCIGIKNI